METHSSIPLMRELIIFLAIAGVAVPLLSRLKISPVLGYFLVGGLIGPFGLGLAAGERQFLSYFVVSNVEEVRAIAEIGVIFLLFTIGLEISLARIWSARKEILGLGSAQVVVTSSAITVILLWMELPLHSAIIVGTALALSSTAIVMQLLISERRQATPVGRTAFSILLMQDLAVVPILFLVGAIATPQNGEMGLNFIAAIATSIATIGVIYALGRLILRPLFREVSLTRNTEMFTATVILAAIGMAALASYFGLSMALGAFLAGLLLAETEYRHQIAVDIEPFKGLLLGLFFVTVGMSLDWRVLIDEPVSYAILVVTLWLLKAGIVVGLSVLMGKPLPLAIEAGLLLGQGGEFAFVILGIAAGVGLVPIEIEEQVVIVAATSMLFTPLVAKLAKALTLRLSSARESGLNKSLEEMQTTEGHVIIVGYGRVGQLLAKLLEAEGQSYVALDADASIVSLIRASNKSVFYGDAGRPEILIKAGINHALAVAITLNDASKASLLVREIHRRWPMTPLHVRARDPIHAKLLKSMGAYSSVPETVEASLLLAGSVLLETGLTPEVVERRISAQRAIENS